MRCTNYRIMGLHMTDEMTGRLESLEQTVETLCRPLADLRAADRLIETERALYESKQRIAALESRVTELERRTTIAEQLAADAIGRANGVLNSRIWQTLVKASSLLTRGR